MATKNSKPSAKKPAPPRRHIGLGRGLDALIGGVSAPAPAKPVAKPVSAPKPPAASAKKPSVPEKKPAAKKTPPAKTPASVAKKAVPTPQKNTAPAKTPAKAPEPSAKKSASVAKKPSAPVKPPSPAKPAPAPVPPPPPASEPAPSPVPPPPAPVANVPAPLPVGARAVIEIAVERIARSPWQPRTTFDQEALAELSESIKAHGVIQPLLCRALPDEKGGGYELIAGERRLRAAVDAGLKTVPVVVVDAVDRDAAEMAIIENIQREDLNIIEEAEGYRTLADRFSLTQQEVADRVGKSRPAVANAMRLLDLPDEVKQLLSSGMLSTGHAKVLLSLPGETEQVLLARRCVTDGLTVRALERAIARREQEKTESETRQLDMPETHIRYLLDLLHKRFNSPVRLKPSITFANGKRAKGSIEIDFADNEDLTRLLDVLGIVVE